MVIGVNLKPWPVSPNITHIKFHPKFYHILAWGQEIAKIPSRAHNPVKDEQRKLGDRWHELLVLRRWLSLLQDVKQLLLFSSIEKKNLKNPSSQFYSTVYFANHRAWAGSFTEQHSPNLQIWFVTKSRQNLTQHLAGTCLAVARLLCSRSTQLKVKLIGDFQRPLGRRYVFRAAESFSTLHDSCLLQMGHLFIRLLSVMGNLKWHTLYYREA